MKEFWLVFLSGQAPGGWALSRLNHDAAKADGIICADGGAAHAHALGLKPSLVVGDGDSLDPALAKELKEQGVSFVSYSTEKDFTDGEAALAAAVEQGASRVLVFGALGGRVDHTLANVLLLRRFAPLLEHLAIIGDDCEIFLCNMQEEITGNPGEIISLLPLSPVVGKIYLKGFLYPLQDEYLYSGSSRGISNILTGERGLITVHGGELLVIQQKNQ